MTKRGPGTWTVSGVNTFSGATTINGGALVIGGAGVLGNGSYSGTIANNSTLILNTSSNQIFSGAISGSGQLSQAGPGMLTLSGSNSYSGGTVLSGGILAFSNTAAVPSTGTITVSGGALVATPIYSSTSPVMGWLNGGLIASNPSGVIALAGGSNDTESITLTGTSSRLSLGAIGSATFGGTLISSGSSYLLGGGGGTLTFNSSLGGNKALTVNGNVVLSASNTYSGATTVAAGNLQLTAPGALYNGNTASWTAANINVSSGAELILNVGGPNDFTPANVNTLLTNLSNTSGSGLQGGTSFGFDTTNAPGAVTYSNAITDSANGPLGIVKFGNGTLVLAATNNTYSGGTALSSGVLQIAALGSLGNGNVNFQGGTLQYGPGVTDDISAQIAPIAGGQAAKIDTNGNGVTFASQLSGNGGLTKVGNGTLTLAAANTYTGPTIVNGGILSVTGGGQIYTTSQVSSIQVNAGGTFQLDGWDLPGSMFSEITQSLGTSGFNREYLVVNGGTVEYVGATNNGTPGNVYGGRGFTIGAQGATLQADNAPGTTWYLVLDNRNGGDYGISSGSGGMLTLSGSGNGEMDKVIPGTGGVTKTGAGTWLLTAANTYTGGTTILNGTLQVGSSSSLGGTSAAALTVNGGTLDVAGFSATTAASLSLLNGSIIDSVGNGALTATAYNVLNGSISAVLAGTASALSKTTSGLVTLSGANTYGGGTTISAGTLALGLGGVLGGGTMSIVPGAVLDLSAFGGGGYNFTSGILGAGRTGSLGTDINGTLNVNGAALTQAGPNRTMTISGALALNGGTLAYIPGDKIASAGGLMLAGIDYIEPASLLPSGTYTLFTYSASGGLTGSTTDLAVGGPYGSSERQSFVFNTSGGTAVTVTVTGFAGNLFWRGGTWDTGVSTSWYNQNTGLADRFFTGDAVTFDDSAGTVNGNVTISGSSGSVQPVSLTVTNSAVNYTFSGTGSIAGATSLLKSGPGSLTIATADSYSGGTMLNAGLLNINDPAALGSGTLTINGGTLGNTSGAGIALSGNNAQNWNASFAFNGSSPLNMGTGAVGAQYLAHDHGRRHWGFDRRRSHWWPWKGLDKGRSRQPDLERGQQLQRRDERQCGRAFARAQRRPGRRRQPRVRRRHAAIHRQQHARLLGKNRQQLRAHRDRHQRAERDLRQWARGIEFRRPDQDRQRYANIGQHARL